MAKAFPQYDLDEEDDHTIAMREGMRALLAMHNQHELDSLCTSLQFGQLLHQPVTRSIYCSRSGADFSLSRWIRGAGSWA